MSSTQRSTIAKLLTVVALLLVTFQGLIPAIPLQNTTLISAVVMFLVTAVTAWKQYLSDEISNAGIRPTLFVAIIATLGGLNELFNVIHFSGTTGQWIRFAITFITAFINVASKILWPTSKTKSFI